MVEYRAVPGFAAYRVGSDGSVWSRWKTGPGGGLLDTWRQCACADNGRGYRSMVLCSGSGRKMGVVHRLVAEAFIPNPDSLPMVRHLNGIRDDNRVENLAWGDAKSNAADMIRHGTSTRGKLRGTNVASKATKLDWESVNYIRDNPEIRSAELAAKFSVTPHAVSEIRRNKVWRDHNYKPPICEPKNYDGIVEAYQELGSVRAVAHRYSVSTMTAYSHLIRRGAPIPMRTSRGVTRPRSAPMRRVAE